MKLESGMYARIREKGIIVKLSILDMWKESEFYGCWGTDNNEIENLHPGDILVAGFNLHNVILEDDYVRLADEDYFRKVCYTHDGVVLQNGLQICQYSNNQIAEILTKEKIEEATYLVKQKCTKE